MTDSGIPILHKLRRELHKGLGKPSIPSVRLRRGDRSFVVPIIYGLGAEHMTLRVEPWFRHITALMAGRDGAFLDIGANIGSFLLRLRLSGETRPYFGFEPNAICSFYLQELIRQNAFDETFAFPIAFANDCGRRHFYARRLGDKLGSFNAFARHEKEKPYSVDMLTMPGDQVLAALDLDQLAFIKVDVEGAELDVLQGLAHTLAEQKPLMLCEIWGLPAESDPSYAQRADNIDRLFAFLNDREYRIHGLANGEFIAVGTAADLTAAVDNYFLVHDDDAALWAKAVSTGAS